MKTTTLLIARDMKGTATLGYTSRDVRVELNGEYVTIHRKGYKLNTATGENKYVRQSVSKGRVLSKDIPAMSLEYVKLNVELSEDEYEKLR